MKVALLISGYLRTFNENLPLLKSRIMEKFENVDVYIHITKDGDKQDKYLNINNDIDYIKKVLNPKCLLYEDNTNISEHNGINNIFNLWRKYYNLNKIKKVNEVTDCQKYDLVIKYRPDLNLIGDNIFDGDISQDIVYIPEDSKIDKAKLLNSYDKYICDIFAYGNSKIMDKYFDIYANLTELMRVHGYISETVLYYYLKQYDIDFKLLPIDYNVILSMCNIFAIAGDSGSGKTTLGNILKKYFSSSFMLECDRYHKWERKDDNWKEFTHLNPEANYLTKMSEDIFDLKIGKTIYQVDYDHSSGTFTQPEKIESSDNIIVCGLHSLYSKDDSVYNLKIFIDTDITLKYTWKIKRDMAKRGYSKEAILSQIESRKDDYIKYILPQKENSDVIINFFTDTEFDIDNLDQKLDIKLKILVNAKHNLIKTLNNFKHNGVHWTLLVGEEYNEITFHEYMDHQLFDNGIKNNNYYDYILYLILNLNK